MKIGVEGDETMLDFRIYTFLAVCQYMNYTRAAEALHITQPAVSQHIRFLENQYQVKLFLCEGRRIRLSAAGGRLLRAATTLKNDEAFLREQLLGAADKNPILKFGTTRTIGESVISTPLADFIRRHPDEGIRMFICNTDELVHKLDAGDIQFALVEGYFNKKKYGSMVFRTEPFIPVCAYGHRFAREPECLRDLLPERLLVREPGSGTRDILEKNLEARDIRLADFAHTTEIGSMHVILQLLERDLGITFLYRTAAERGLEEGIFRELPLCDFQMEHDFAFIWNRGSIYEEEYREICRELQ